MQAQEPSFVLIDGRRIAYDEVCPADPEGTVLLLAGADSDRLTWYKQRDVFGRVFRTIALDYRDTGESDPVSEPYTIADLAEDAAFVLDALGVLFIRRLIAVPVRPGLFHRVPCFALKQSAW